MALPAPRNNTTRMLKGNPTVVLYPEVRRFSLGALVVGVLLAAALFCLFLYGARGVKYGLLAGTAALAVVAWVIAFLGRIGASRWYREHVQRVHSLCLVMGLCVLGVGAGLGYTTYKDDLDHKCLNRIFDGLNRFALDRLTYPGTLAEVPEPFIARADLERLDGQLAYSPQEGVRRGLLRLRLSGIVREEDFVEYPLNFIDPGLKKATAP
jgi:hypothetical protein